MNSPPPHPPHAQPIVQVPAYWTPDQALAVIEFLHTLRKAIWLAHGTAIQQAWQDQLMTSPDPGDSPLLDEDRFDLPF